MNHGDIDSIIKGIAPAVFDLIAKGQEASELRLKEQEARIAELTKRLDDLPQPEPVDLAAVAALVEVPEPIPGKDAEPVDLEALAKAAAALIPAPTVDVASIAAEAATLVEVPEPIPGKDAEPVDLAAVAKAAAELIEVPGVDLAAVAALVEVPEPIPGKDAEPVDLEALAKAAAALVPVPEAPAAEHGRDAIDLVVLPGIDETKQYPRNTYAAHRGGMWKSYETTHGMRGWECIVDGIEGVTVTQDSVREFSVTLSKSSGASTVQKVCMPIQIYKGVFRDDEQYEQHDTVTWAGSQWTSSKGANTDKPGTSDAWVLTVKAGRNGKDLRENASSFDPSKGVKL